MNDKTPGQIAFEANQEWYNHVTPWQEIAPAQQALWQHIGQAVAQAVAPMPEMGES